MEQYENVAIFWDFENCKPGTDITGYNIVENIRSIAQQFGSVKSFKAYLDISQNEFLISSSLRTELQASGVSLTDCAHNKRDGAETMLIVDMMTYMADNPLPATILLISGDRDYSYAVAILRLRRYRVVVISPPGTNNILMTQASVHLNWNSEVLVVGQETSREPPAFDNPTYPPPAVQRRTSSTKNHPSTPSSKTRVDRDGGTDNDEDLHKSLGAFRPKPNKYLTDIDGDVLVPSQYSSAISKGQPSLKSNFLPGTPMRSLSPAPSQVSKAPEPKFSSILYERPDDPGLSKGRPLSETEHTILKSPVVATRPPFEEFYQPNTINTAETKASEVTVPPAGSASVFEIFVAATKLPTPTLDVTSLPPTLSAPATMSFTIIPQPEHISPASAPAPISSASVSTLTTEPTGVAVTQATSLKASMPAITVPMLPPPPKPMFNKSPETVLSLVPSSEQVLSPMPVSEPALSPMPTLALVLPAPASLALAPAPALVPTSILTPAPAPAPAPEPPAPEPVVVQQTVGSTAAPADPVSGPSSSPPRSAPLKKVPLRFKTLIERLEFQSRSTGRSHISRSDLAVDLAKHPPPAYEQGASKIFKKYIKSAHDAGVIEIGGSGSEQWVSAAPGWLS